MKYPIMIAPLSEADGGGFVGLAPDLYGCMSDGATPEEALANTREAIGEWIDGSKELGRAIPEPGSAARRAVEAAKALRGKLEEAFKIQAGLEERFTALEAEIADLHEKADEVLAWGRFADLVNMPMGPSGNDLRPPSKRRRAATHG